VKIVQAVGWYAPESLGGTEIYVAALARHLHAAGHEVTVAAPQAGIAGLRRYEHEGIPVLRYPIPERPGRAEAQGELPARGSELFHAWLREEKPDRVHFHTFVTGLGLFELGAARAAGARTVVTTHSSSLGYLCQRGTLMRWGSEPCDGIALPAKCAACALEQRGLPRAAAAALGRLPPAFSRWARPLPGPLGTALALPDLIVRNLGRERALIDAADRFVLLTAWALEAVAGNGFPRAKLALNRLGHALPDARRKPGPDERPTAPPVRLGYLGRFDPIKGLEVLVRAAVSLPAAVPFRLELHGPAGGDAERAFRARLEALAAGDPRIAFHPPTPPAGIADLLAGWDALVCPALCYEGGPTVAIEAQAVGTPVIGSAIGGLAELVRHDRDGRLLPPGDAAALAATIRELAEDPAGTVDAWRRRPPAARTMAEVARDYLELYGAL
jgi:glycosyltransferase involved in cell wall biosynthesis